MSDSNKRSTDKNLYILIIRRTLGLMLFITGIIIGWMISSLIFTLYN